MRVRRTFDKYVSRGFASAQQKKSFFVNLYKEIIGVEAQGSMCASYAFADEKKELVGEKVGRRVGIEP